MFTFYKINQDAVGLPTALIPGVVYCASQVTDTHIFFMGVDAPVNKESVTIIPDGFAVQQDVVEEILVTFRVLKKVRSNMLPSNRVHDDSIAELVSVNRLTRFYPEDHIDTIKSEYEETKTRLFALNVI